MADGFPIINPEQNIDNNTKSSSSTFYGQQYLFKKYESNILILAISVDEETNWLLSPYGSCCQSSF